MEWSDRNKYCSFNSFKGLTYYENYKKIVKWMDDEDSIELPPPIECNLDPIAECNLSCYFCVTQRYLRKQREEVGEMRILPTEYIFRLIDFLAKWGVKGLCISGGGEPTLHKDQWRFLPYAKDRGMDVAVVTNATNISKRLAESLMCCRWVALSVDFADRETYKAVKGSDKFADVIANISHLAKLREQTKSSVALCFKLLVLSENVNSIYEACKLAKEMGIQDFHARPVDFERSDIEGARKLAFNMPKIYEEFAKCRELEDDKFHVYTVTHKFDPEFHVKHDFERCLATPLVIPILTDGNAYLCVDRKMEAQFRLGSCYPDPENILTWWGGQKQRQVIKSVNPSRCSRCTWSQYNRQIEEVAIRDGMCLAFP